MAASYGTLNILGKSGRTWSIDCYVPDATATYLGFNATGLSGTASPTTFVVPEDGIIVDYVQVAAPTAVGFNIILNSAAQPGMTLRHANQLCTLANRQKLVLPVKAGDQMQALQF